MKEQSQSDQVLFGLLDQLQRILPFANTIADDVICEDTEVLEEIILQLFEVMQRVANFSMGYVTRRRTGKQPSFLDHKC